MRYLTALLAAMVLLAAACSSGDDNGSSSDGFDEGEPTADQAGGSEENGDPGDADAETDADPGDQAEDSGGLRPQTLGEQASGVVEGATAQVINLLGPDGGVPLSDGDFADPFVLDSGLVPYGFTTNSTTANVPVSRPGLRGEVELGDALPEVGSWTEEGLVWAPGVIELADDQFVLYYTSKDLESGLQCIGVATSSSARGPYVDDRGEPFICQRELGGSIDASPAMIGDTPWLVWKGDGNCCGLPTTLWAQQLGPDGTTLVGDRHGMAANDQDWEGPLVEGPSIVQHDGRIHLFYSANWWDSADYSIGHAVCESITGPCEKDPEPFLTSGEEYSGPGGQEFFTDRSGQLWMAFHAWLPGEVGYEDGGQRRLFLERIEFDDSGSPKLVD